MSAVLYTVLSALLKNMGDHHVEGNTQTWELSELALIVPESSEPLVKVEQLGLDLFLDENDNLYMMDVDDEESEDGFSMYAMDNPDLIRDVKALLALRIKMLKKYGF